ncbi:hypothetical protein [Streptomyces sp. NPDC046821]|uniref:hypothetical protein n=1 Tax=Streptomyces sp. NPDC046821 TaxID=3154702 RepID=UPI0033E19203
MAARKAATPAVEDKPADAEEAPQDETVVAIADEVHERGGWDAGYRGDRVDPVDDDAYTVSGVLKAAESGDE